MAEVNPATYVRAVCVRWHCNWRGLIPRGPLGECPRCPRCGAATDRTGTTQLELRKLDNG